MYTPTFVHMVVLRNRMEYFNKLNRSQTKISAVQSELNQARNVMVS